MQIQNKINHMLTCSEGNSMAVSAEQQMLAKPWQLCKKKKPNTCKALLAFERRRISENDSQKCALVTRNA